jgi:hypothetical protein
MGRNTILASSMARVGVFHRVMQKRYGGCSSPPEMEVRRLGRHLSRLPETSKTCSVRDWQMPSGERFAEEGKARKISTPMLPPTKRELAGDFEQEGEKLDGQSEGMTQRPYPVTEPPTTSPIGATMPADHQGTRGESATIQNPSRRTVLAIGSSWVSITTNPCLASSSALNKPLVVSASALMLVYRSRGIARRGRGLRRPAEISEDLAG